MKIQQNNSHFQFFLLLLNKYPKITKSPFFIKLKMHYHQIKKKVDSRKYVNTKALYIIIDIQRKEKEKQIKWHRYKVY